MSHLRLEKPVISQFEEQLTAMEGRATGSDMAQLCVAYMTHRNTLTEHERGFMLDAIQKLLAFSLMFEIKVGPKAPL